MQKNKFFKLGMVVLLAVTMAACSSTDTEEDTGDTSASDNSSMGGSNSDSSTSSTGIGGGNSLSASELREQENQTEALAMTVFYFEFDRSDLSAEAREALVYHANRLKENSGMRIRLEGHADERGTREYNLALGERRAQSIERYLQVQGVSSSQMETISYGEESPVASGSSQAAYARNRRVEIH